MKLSFETCNKFLSITFLRRILNKYNGNLELFLLSFKHDKGYVKSSSCSRHSEEYNAYRDFVNNCYFLFHHI